METTKAEGALQKSAADIQEAVGEDVGRTGEQVSGKANELSVKAQKLYGDVRGMVRDSTAGRPFTALGIAAAIGFVLGMLRAVNRSER